MTQLILQEESARAIKAFASRVLRRCHSAGARSLERGDIENELWIAYMKACQEYDPTHGVPFLAYLRNGMRLHINRFVENNVSKRISEVISASLDGERESESGDEFSLESVIPSQDPTPDQIALQNSNYEKVLSSLSERARLFLTLLHDQPQPLLEQVRQINAKVEYARGQGIPAYATNHLTIATITEFMGATRSEREKIMKEIDRAVQALEHRPAKKGIEISL